MPPSQLHTKENERGLDKTQLNKASACDNNPSLKKRTGSAVSIIIPVYNERCTIFEIIKKIQSVPLEKEIIIVDDGSTDGTRELLQLIENDQDIRVLYHSHNMGKGMAIRTAIPHVSLDVVIIQDADLEYDPNDYPRLISPLKQGIHHAVYGTREGLPGNTRSHLRYFWGGKFLTWLTNLLYGSNLTDMPTCYKAFNTKLFKALQLTCQQFEFCPEVTAKILKQGHTIGEVPIHYYPRKIKDGKKIRCKDGLQAIYTLLQLRFFE